MNRSSALALSAGALGALVLVPQTASGQARPADPGRPQPTPTAVPKDESGCRDVVSGVVSYQQFVQSIKQDPYVAAFPAAAASSQPYKKAVVTTADRGVATAKVVLAEPSCTDVTYTLVAYDANGAIIGRHSQLGDGTTGGSVDTPFIVETTVRGHSSRTVGMRLFVTSGGTEHDQAPDPGTLSEEAVANVDGLPPNTGPAGTSFN